MMKKIPDWLKNKYAYSIIAFLIWISFIDQNNIITQYSYHSQLNILNREKEYFETAIEKTKKELYDLTENPATLEKFQLDN